MSLFETVTAALLLAQSPEDHIYRAPLGTINIPDEISPAIMPYFRCLMANRGVAMGPPGPNQAISPPGGLGGDCSQERATARHLAENMMRAQRRGTRTERRAYVERTLAIVDRFVSTIPVPGATIEGEPDAPN